MISDQTVGCGEVRVPQSWWVAQARVKTSGRLDHSSVRVSNPPSVRLHPPYVVARLALNVLETTNGQ